MNFIAFFVTICTFCWEACSSENFTSSSNETETYVDSEDMSLPTYNRTIARFPLKNQISKGISDFKALTQCSCFVDKTMLIKVFLQDQKNLGEDTYHLITCPRRFGKSTNLDMIKRFAAIQVDEKTGEILEKTTHENYQLFTNDTLKLKISQHEEFLDQHLMAHPIIYIDFMSVNSLDQDEMVVQLKHIVLDVLHSHSWLNKFLNRTYPDYDTLTKNIQYKYQQYLKGFNENELIIYMARSLRYLTEFLYEYFGNKKVIVLIDGYDKPIHKVIGRGKPADDIMNKIGIIISQLIKGNQYVSRALITGISGALVQTDSSDLNRPNLCHWRFLDDHTFAPFYGFSDEEVTQLFIDHGIEEEEGEAVKDFYNGYKVRNTGEIIYNPLSIVTYLSRRILRSYWLETGSILSIKPFLKQNEFRKHIVELLLGSKESCITIREVCSIKDLEDLHDVTNNVTSEIENSLVKSYFSYFFEQGYLSHTLVEGFYTVPNKEIELEFGDVLELYYSDQHKDDLTTVGNFLSIIVESENVTDEMIDTLKSSLERLFELTYTEYRVSTKKLFANEFDFHAQIYAAAKLYYGDYVSGERWMRKIARTGRKKIRSGRPDISILTKHNGLVIIEVKHRKSVEIALQQAMLYRPTKSIKPQFMKFMGVNIDEKRRVGIDIAPRILNISAVDEFEALLTEKKPRTRRKSNRNGRGKNVSKRVRGRYVLPQSNLSLNVNVDFHVTS